MISQMRSLDPSCNCAAPASCKQPGQAAHPCLSRTTPHWCEYHNHLVISGQGMAMGTCTAVAGPQSLVLWSLQRTFCKSECRYTCLCTVLTLPEHTCQCGHGHVRAGMRQPYSFDTRAAKRVVDSGSEVAECQYLQHKLSIRYCDLQECMVKHCYTPMS